MSDVTRPDADVVVVGYGPVGMAMAVRLAQLGYRVTCLERYAGLYNLPRAAIFDDETMRTFDQIGIAEHMLPLIKPQPNYEWRNADGELLLEVEYAPRGRAGWAEWYMMYQPDLESALDARCRELGVDVRFSSPVVGYTTTEDAVQVHVDGGESLTAAYVVACDGGNSFTRSFLGIDEVDHGFAEPWMVCDFRLTGPIDLPDASQVCNPAQPQSIISLGPTHHRFSFMLDSEEAFASEADPEKVWRRVSTHLTPDDAELIRVATYTFRSRIATRWRSDRILLAGDAAHQMPPFLGQGMCSGIRDAQNLAFKLDLILRGLAGPALLDTYQSEREPHVTFVVLKGKELGSIQTMRDPEAAARRDEEYLARRRASVTPDKVVFPGLGPGVVRSNDPADGRLAIQGRVACPGADGPDSERPADDEPNLFDRVVGYGATLVVDGRAMSRADADGLAAGSSYVGRVVVVGGDGDVADPAGDYAAFFDNLGVVGVLVRPDFYMYGCARQPGDLGDLVRSYEEALGGSVGQGVQASAPSMRA